VAMKSVFVERVPSELTVVGGGPGKLPPRICRLPPDAFAHETSASKPHQPIRKLQIAAALAANEKPIRAEADGQSVGDRNERRDADGPEGRAQERTGDLVIGERAPFGGLCTHKVNPGQ
jgi:hypothetical protein